MNLPKLGLVLPVLGMLASCTETQRWEAARGVRLDLEAAYARAEAFGDEIAKRCYGELITAARRIEAETGIVGPADAYQRARNINIRAITTSEIKFSVLIDAAYTELAVRTLHTLYGLDQA